jgi:hypothetical protein
MKSKVLEVIEAIESGYRHGQQPPQGDLVERMLEYDRVAGEIADELMSLSENQPEAVRLGLDPIMLAHIQSWAELHS